MKNDTVQIVKPEGDGAVVWDSNILNGADPESAGHDLTVIDAWGQSDDQAVRWTNVENSDDTVSVTSFIDSLRAGLKDLASAFRRGLSDVLRRVDFAGISTRSLAAALNGLVRNRVRDKDLNLLRGRSQVRDNERVQIDNAHSILLRLFEQGGLDLAQVASNGSIPDLNTLRQALDDLDSTDGNVSLDTTTDRDEDGIPDIFFELELVDSQLEGIVDLSVAANLLGSAGQVELNGSVEIMMTIDLDLSFGVDSQGFFIAPNAATDPELTVRDMVVSGEVAGNGRIGFLSVDLKSASLDLDPTVEIAVNLGDPGTSGTDNLIRPPELKPTDFLSLLNVAIRGDPEDGRNDDVVLTANFSVSELDTDLISGLNFSDAALIVSWPDVTNPAEVTLAASATAGQQQLNFLAVDSQEFSRSTGHIARPVGHLRRRNTHFAGTAE